MVKQVAEKPSFKISDQFSIGQDNWDDADFLAVSQISMSSLFKTIAIENTDCVQPLAVSDKPLDVLALKFDDPLITGRSISGEVLLNRRLFNDALLVMHKGRVIHESYRNGMQATDRHVIHSCTKSLCSMIVAMAVDEGLLNPQALVSDYIDEFKDAEAWQTVTVQHVWDMQAGIRYSEDYTDPAADYWRYARAAGYYPPLEGEKAIGVKAWVFGNLNRRSDPPGTIFAYNSTLTIVLGIILENVYGLGLGELFENKIYSKIGAHHTGYFNTDLHDFPIVEGQLNLTLRDFARCGRLMINNGKNQEGLQVLPVDFVNRVVGIDQPAGQAYHDHISASVFPQSQYRNHFWVLEPEQQQLAMIGIHGQFSWCDLKNDLLIVGVGSYPKQDGNLMMSVMKTLWNGVTNAVVMPKL